MVEINFRDVFDKRRRNARQVIFNRLAISVCRFAEIHFVQVVGDSRRILKRIAPEILQEFKNKQIRYDRNLCSDSVSGFGWQNAFETEDKQTIGNYCRASGIDFRWRNGGGLRISQIRLATLEHPQTGEEVWFNQADGFHPSNLDTETYQSLICLMSEEDFRFKRFFRCFECVEINCFVSKILDIKRKTE